MDKRMWHQFVRVSPFILYFLTSLTQATTLSACGHHDYPPWNWKKDNQIVGVCAEVASTLFKKLGVTLDLSYTGPWARCQEQIRNGSVDVNICSFINSEREQYSTFATTPMGYNENAIFVKKGKEFPFTNWENLAGKTAVMVRGVSIGSEFDHFIENNTQIIRLNNYHQSFTMLMKGRADFLPVGRFTGLAMRNKFGMNQDIVALDWPILVGELYISMSHNSPHIELIHEIQKQIDTPEFNAYVEGLIPQYIQSYTVNRQASQ